MSLARSPSTNRRWTSRSLLPLLVIGRHWLLQLRGFFVNAYSVASHRRDSRPGRGGAGVVADKHSSTARCFGSCRLRLVGCCLWCGAGGAGCAKSGGPSTYFLPCGAAGWTRQSPGTGRPGAVSSAGAAARGGLAGRLPRGLAVDWQGSEQRAFRFPPADLLAPVPHPTDLGRAHPTGRRRSQHAEIARSCAAARVDDHLDFDPGHLTDVHRGTAGDTLVRSDCVPRRSGSAGCCPRTQGRRPCSPACCSPTPGPAHGPGRAGRAAQSLSPEQDRSAGTSRDHRKSHLVIDSLAHRRPGPYPLQTANTVHAEDELLGHRLAADLALYGVLDQLVNDPTVTLNRAVALAQVRSRVSPCWRPQGRPQARAAPQGARCPPTCRRSPVIRAWKTGWTPAAPSATWSADTCYTRPP